MSRRHLRTGKESDSSPANLARREFVKFSVAAGVGFAAPVTAEDLKIVETDVEVKTADGTCDAVFLHPEKGKYPGVLIWPDSRSLRPVFREIGRRLASEGYAVLVPNHLYRTAKAPVFPAIFDPVKNPDDAAFYGVKAGEYMHLRVGGPCATTFDRMLVRIHADFKLEVHIDTDEGNACALQPDTPVELLK